MRIYGPNGTTLGSPAANARRTGPTGFSLPDATAATDETRAAAAPGRPTSIDALLALQGVEDARSSAASARCSGARARSTCSTI